MLAFSTSSTQGASTRRTDHVAQHPRPGVLFLIVALIAALFGFGGVPAESWIVAKVFFFLVLAVLSFAGGYFGRTRNA
jgi:uncharacterized membrane protein YtjA (UPF0391 family)